MSLVADGGHVSDIQAALDLAVANEIENVMIPEGTFNLVEPGETWTPVIWPPGVNIFGAETLRDQNDQVIEWKTKLIMPFEAPAYSWFFRCSAPRDTVGTNSSLRHRACRPQVL